MAGSSPWLPPRLVSHCGAADSSQHRPVSWHLLCSAKSALSRKTAITTRRTYPSSVNRPMNISNGHFKGICPQIGLSIYNQASISWHY
jgi:hypothetical protein